MAARAPWTRRLIPALAALLLVPAAAGAGGQAARSTAALEAEVARGNGVSAHYLMGVYDLAPHHAILDGDTLKVAGLPHTLRLLGIDTEEIYHHKGRRAMAEKDFAAYYKRIRGHGRPVKTGTPMGIAAMRWAERFFRGIHRVRLEYDALDRKQGYYDRYLVYVFAKKGGHWVDYNLAAVRAGMAPYFDKYGRLARFDRSFVAAQTLARRQHLGIWNPKRRHYPDYPERLAWWNARARALRHFERAHGKDPAYVALGIHGAMDRLRKRSGKVVTVFGAAARVRRDQPPFLFPIEHRLGDDFELVAFTKGQLDWLDPARWEGEYVYVRGKVSLYHGRPEMKATQVHRIWTE